MGIVKVNKIKASTLTEVIIAMTILGIITGVAMMTLTNIFNNSTSIKEVQLNAALDSEISRVRATKNLNNQSINYDDFSVEVEFGEYFKNKEILVGYFSVILPDEEQPLVEKKILIKP